MSHGQKIKTENISVTNSIEALKMVLIKTKQNKKIKYKKTNKQTETCKVFVTYQSHTGTMW